MINDLKIGLSKFAKSFGFVVKHNLWIYLIPSFILTVITYYFLFAFESNLANWSNWVEDIWWIGSGLKWLIDEVSFVMVFVLIEINKFLVLTVLSPMIALLSEKTEKIITGNEYPFDFNQLMKDVLRGIFMALRNITLELLLIICWYLIAAITGLKILSPVIILAIGSYFYGFSFIDYINERRRLSIAESAKFVRKHFGLTMIIGGVFSVLFIIPFAGMVFAAPIAVIIATLAVNDLVDLRGNKFAVQKKLENDQASIDI